MLYGLQGWSICSRMGLGSAFRPVEAHRYSLSETFHRVSVSQTYIHLPRADGSQELSVSCSIMDLYITLKSNYDLKPLNLMCAS